jgi:hypothetical protein
VLEGVVRVVLCRESHEVDGQIAVAVQEDLGGAGSGFGVGGDQPELAVDGGVDREGGFAGGVGLQGLVGASLHHGHASGRLTPSRVTRTWRSWRLSGWWVSRSPAWPPESVKGTDSVAEPLQASKRRRSMQGRALRRA